MSGPLGSSQWMYASGEDYTIDQSVRLNDVDSAYLSWTPTSAGNRQVWTYSVWIKLGSVANVSPIFMAGDFGNAGGTTNNGTGLLLYSNGVMYSYWDNAAGGTTTSAILRDPSAWYHICLRADAATDGNLKLYINGVLQTTKSISGNAAINSATNHNIGNYPGTGTTTFDGYMAEANFIDGQALTPADFGETGDYGEWKPIEYEGTYGTNGFYLNFAGGGIMSATGGNSTATDGDYKAASFTADGTFTPSADGYVEYLVVGGGGNGAGFGASSVSGGGGGAGGYRTGYLAVTGGTGYSITVGAATEDSVFSSITSAGGGNGGQPTPTSGGSGGGSGAASPSGAAGTSGQGNAGGTGTGTWGVTTTRSGGGGGSGGVGGNSDGTNGGAAGAGTASSITGSSVTYAAGGEGVAHTRNTAGTPGAANTGNGGGGTGGSGGNSGGAGGSGIVIIRYKFQ